MAGRGRWIAAAAGAGLIAALVAGAAFLGAFSGPARPSQEALAAYRAKAASYDVRIRRDTFGVPHVKGATDADAAFGLAFAHCEDDLKTIVETVRATRGELAAAAGQGAAIGDYLVAWLDVWATAREAYPTLPGEVRAVLEAYADGLNACIAATPKPPAGVLPVTGLDLVAGATFRTPFFFGLDRTLRDLTAPQAEDGPPPKGSNGVAAAPSRSADGATRLLVNSHQPFEGPVAWYEAVVESGEGWHVAGGFFPGGPFMLHGHTPTLGWASTVNTPDLIDVYQLTLDPEDRNAYRLDGESVPFERRFATFRVKLWGPFSWPVRREVLKSRHGPAMRTKGGVFAVRYAGIGEARNVVQQFAMNKARTLADFQTAMALQALPSINYIYADAAGNIGFVHNGLYPERDPALDWTSVLPGDRSALIWRRYRPFSEVPQVWNPRCGLVFNANNDPRAATACPDDGLDPARLPATLGLQDNMTNRAWRILETYGADPAITAEAFARYKFDVAASPRSEIRSAIDRVLAEDLAGDPRLKAAQDLLRGWSGSSDRADQAAALANGVTAPILRARVEGKPPPDPRDTFRAAVDHLERHFGRLDPPWGEVNRLRRGALDLPLDGAPDVLRSVWAAPQPDGRLKAVAGDTLVMIVAWDRAGRLESRSIHQYGAATVDPASPHYADQAPLFARHELKPVWFTEADLAPHIARDYRPLE